MKKTYKKEFYLYKEDWLKARGIGGSEASAILGKNNWLTKDDMYNKLANGIQPKVVENDRMKEGTLAEEHIRTLYALDSKYKVTSPPKKTHWLFRSKIHPLLTCTPDGFVETELGKWGLEIKDVEMRNKTTKDLWESNTIPDNYYIQCLHYMVVMDDLMGVVLVAHLKYFKFEDLEWKFDYAIDKPFWIYRDEVKNQIEYLKEKELDFIQNNVEKKHRPTMQIKF